MGEQLKDGDAAGLWVESRGSGPDVLLIAGLGDPVEAWEPQLEGLADRYRVTAFDNRGSGRTPLPEEPLTPASMADDAAAVLGGLGIPSAHVVGFSMGGCIAQELALRHPDVVRSLVLISSYARPDALVRSIFDFWRWLPDGAPGDRAFYKAFFTWVYTPRAHESGLVDEVLDEAMAFEHRQSVEGFRAQVDVCVAHDTAERLARITVPTLVISGEQDVLFPPRFGESIAAAIPNARLEVLPGEAHQPFQESPDDFNVRVDAFWREVESAG
jgi:pimeloyl-ACP methyl ester carboxylesterase